MSLLGGRLTRVTSEMRTPDTTTRGEPPRFVPGADAVVEGILWVYPEERFDPLRSDALIGRAEDCDLRLTGSGVSRRHARIEREGPLWVLRDLESRNGTFVNARARPRAPLSEQDTLRVGDWVGVVCHLPSIEAASEGLFRTLGEELVLSAPTLAALNGLERLSRSDVSLVIQGETGTGKEVLARAIHRLSGRSGPLVAINCAAIPESLVEAALFGHKKGAFTGAVASELGHIASAAGGTVFLDEIVELPLAAQSKLLRALEERTITPVGSSQALKVDFRLLASAQEPLESLVDAGAFRADLYARLNGAELRLPPLRQRRQEVLRLLRRSLGPGDDASSEFDSHLIEALCRYDWPYNVRELCQLARLFRASGQSSFGLKDLPRRFLEPRRAADAPSRSVGHDEKSAPPSQSASWLTRHATELARLRDALRGCKGNVSEAARLAGIPRHLARRLLAAEAGLSGR